MPPQRIIKAMRQANPHGMGFCTPSMYRKDVDNFRAFCGWLRKRDINEPCLMHFRLATHGSIKRDNCHPFHDAKTGVYFAHNGILAIRPTNDKTDSETAFRKRFLPVIKKHGFDSKELDEEVTKIIGSSRFVFMQCDTTKTKIGAGGEINVNVKVKMFGDFEEMDGCFYSNLRFLYYL